MNEMVDMRGELTAHWKEEYNWQGLSIAKLAQRYKCSMDEVRTAIAEIQKDNPRPSRQVYDTCKSCGAPIVWMNRHPFNAKMLKGAAADGKIQSFRESHFATCPNANQHRKAN